MKNNCSQGQMVRTVRELGVSRRLEAIRFVRSLGFSFVPAKTYVDEILAGARWWRNY